MSDDDDIDGLAAEYVIGTLDAEERAAVEARRRNDARLDSAIIFWERRLSPLLDAIASMTPPSGLFSKIVAQIDRGGSPVHASAIVIDLTRRVARWRFAAIGASAIAACLALAIGVREFAPKPKTQNLVAVLQKDAASPAFLVTVNVEDRVMTVRPVAAKREAGKSYELWIVQDSLGAPRSLGVIDEPGAMVRPNLAAYKPEVIQSATFAVSLEPEGGSPTGKPTDVKWAGKVIPSN